MPAPSDLTGEEINYLHAAVKATVDAETGETHLYRTDDGDDPILAARDSVYPELLEPIDRLPESLEPNLRYPDDLWTVQSSLIGRYHVDTAEQLFSGTDRWAISAAAATAVGEPTTTPASSVDLFTPLAGSSDGFAAVRPYGPGSGSNPTMTRDELAAIAVADHDLGGHIHLIVPDLDGGQPLLSPQVGQSAIDADPEFARVITLLNANGSKVQFGPMAPLIFDRSSCRAPDRRRHPSFGVAAVSDGQVAVRATAVAAVAALDDPDAASVDADISGGATDD